MEVWSTGRGDEEVSSSLVAAVPNAVMPPPAFHVAHKDECSRSFPLASFKASIGFFSYYVRNSYVVLKIGFQLLD